MMITKKTIARIDKGGEKVNKTTKGTNFDLISGAELHEIQDGIREIPMNVFLSGVRTLSASTYHSDYCFNWQFLYTFLIFLLHFKKN